MADKRLLSPKDLIDVLSSCASSASGVHDLAVGEIRNHIHALGEELEQRDHQIANLLQMVDQQEQELLEMRRDNPL